MKRLIQWIQIPDFAPLPVMDRVFEECTAAFKDDGCAVRRVTRWEEVEDGGLIFLDDAGGRYRDPSFQPHHERLATMCPKSVMICWYWMDTTYRPFQQMLVTGEHHIHRRQISPEKQAYMLRPDFVPLLLRANEPPERVGTYPREPQRDYCFMGGGYKMDWIPPQERFTGLYHRVIYTNYLSYEDRRAIYLSSRFALAFQSDENIHTGHLSQRIFEGLAYGCIVFCENPLASQYTRGAVITVTSREDLWAKMEEWSCASPDQLREQQERGYNWIRRYGTNRVSMALLWNRVKARFHVDWDQTVSVDSIMRPLVSITLMGGLGNQLFQLAAGYTYAHRHGALFRIMDCPPIGGRPTYWDSILQHFRPFLVRELPPMIQWEQGPATVYRPIPALTEKNLLLNGYFQSSKYFPTHLEKERIRLLFRSPSDIEHAVRHTYPFLFRVSQRVVVVHARRTDYITHAAFHGPLPMSYYRRAVDQMLSTVKEPFFLLCGDDPSFWSTLATDLPEVHSRPHFVLQGESDIRTFALLTQFRHFIISNSTFLWWAAWMAEQVAPTRVIAPSQWFGPSGISEWEDIYESHWERCPS